MDSNILLTVTTQIALIYLVKHKLNFKRSLSKYIFLMLKYNPMECFFIAIVKKYIKRFTNKYKTFLQFHT